MKKTLKDKEWYQPKTKDKVFMSEDVKEAMLEFRERSLPEYFFKWCGDNSILKQNQDSLGAYMAYIIDLREEIFGRWHKMEDKE